MRPITYEKQNNGVIRVGGVGLKALASEYGTPLYVMDYQTILDRMAGYQSALSDWGSAYYASKALCCRAILELVKHQGWGVDVVSGGELYTAFQAGFDARAILFHGNAKSLSEIRTGLQAGVGHFVVDSLDELERLDEEARRQEVMASVLIRITPGIAAHTHEFIRTGEFDSKFGFATEGGRADEAVNLALSLSSVRLSGFHAHIGSQILDAEPFLASAQALLMFSTALYERTGFWPQVLDIGGGLGVTYQTQDRAPTPQEVLGPVSRWMVENTPKGLKPPRIWVEPGRSIVADAGFTLYRVDSVKTTPTGRTYVTVDGGMGDNVRPALYGAEYAGELDEKPEGLQSRTVAVAGRYCESGDVLMGSVELKDPKAGDLLVVWTTGAYAYSMASTYNRVPRPAMVMVRAGQASIWVERETWGDLVQHDQPLVLRD